MDPEAEKKAMEAAAAKLKSEAEAAATKAANDAVKASEEKFEAKLKASEEASEAKLKTMQTQLDDADIAIKRGTGERHFGSTLGAALEDFTKHADQLKNRRKGQSVEFELSEKGANDMLTPATAPGRVIEPARRLGVIAPLDSLTHVRDVMNVAPISTNSMEYLRETGFTGAPAMTAEGATKPQVKVAYETVVGTVKKIAAYFKVSTELAADFPALMGYLKARVQEKISLLEDQQIIYGDNTGNNLQGIYPLASAFSVGPLPLIAAFPQNADVLRAAIAQVRRSQGRANAIMMNPDDVAQMELMKDEEGRYILPTIWGGMMPSIGRTNIVELDAMTAGQFLVGAFDLGAQLFQREGISVRMFDQNEDDAITNKVTVVIEERLMQQVYRPELFVKGTYAAAKAALAD